jgi:hypothetical protein
MQIFELTQPKQRKLNEYDPSRSPPGTPNYATGVGPGVKPQMTATPTVNGAPPATATTPVAPAAAPAVDTTPAAPATGNTVNKADSANPNIAAQTPYVQGRAGQGANPTRFAKYDPNTSSMANLDQGMQAMTAPASAPATPNYGTGVGPGVKSQMTATPTVSGASTVTPASTPASAPAAAPNYSAGSYKQPTSNAPFATVPAMDDMMPTNMSSTGNPVAQPATAPAGIDPQLAAAGKVGLTAAPGRKANIGGAIANAMMKHNASQTGLGFMLPKDPDNEVYVDRNGQITVGGKPYDAANPEHQRAAGKITIKGQPYNGANPEHRAAYLAFKNTAGRGGRDTVKIDANGGVTVLGQPFDPANPAHVQEYRRHVLGSSVEQTPPPAPAQQLPAARPAQPAQPNPVAQTPEQIRLAKQKAAASAAQQSMTPKVTTTESLTWSRKFDPSATLLKKMKSQP